MVSSSLIEVIKLLHGDELVEIRHYLDTPLQKRNLQHSDSLRLFEIIVEASPDFLPDQLERGVVYKRLYGEGDAVPGKLEKAMTELSKQIKSFLLAKEYLRSENEFAQRIDWAVWLRKRGSAHRYMQAIQKLERLQQENASPDADFHYRQFLLEQEKHNWENLSNQIRGDVNLPSVLHHLDIFYHLNRLEFLNRLLLQQTMTLITPLPEIDLSLKVLDSIAPIYLRQNPILFAASCIFRLQQYSVPPKGEFEKFRQWLTEHELEMGTEFRYRFWAYLRGRCSVLINAGNEELIPVLHQIHQDNLSKGYLFFEDKLSPSAYKNVTYVALAAKEEKWALAFVEKYKDVVIGENETRDFYRLNLATCLFAIREYAKALDILPQASSYSDYHSATKRLELKIYYEMNSPLLPYKIDSFKMYVHRAGKHLLSKMKKELLLNFVNLLQQIAQSPDSDKARSQKILARIEKKKAVAEKSWLVEKAKELA